MYISLGLVVNKGIGYRGIIRTIFLHSLLTTSKEKGSDFLQRHRGVFVKRHEHDFYVLLVLSLEAGPWPKLH